MWFIRVLLGGVEVVYCMEGMEVVFRAKAASFISYSGKLVLRSRDCLILLVQI